MPALSGVTVVVTRPAHQAENLCQHIESAGGKVLRFPVIEVRPPENAEQCRAQMARLVEYDLAIFVSANAVTGALALLESTQSWPVSLPIAAVGKATAQVIISEGLPSPLVAPRPFNSEALLGLPDFQKLNGKRILVFRGSGGRELLRDSLLERGAEVDYLECYRREVPQSDTRALYAAWDQRQTMPIVVTSNQGLENLVSMIDCEHQAQLLASPLIVMSERAVSLSSKLGFTQAPIVAAAANDEAILDSLKTWVRP